MLAPTRELASQIVEELRAVAHAAALRDRGRLRRRRLSQAGGRGASHIVVATPGRLEDLLAATRVQRSTRSACSCSTRPTACSTWASGRRSTGSSALSRSAPDTVLLGDARRRRRRGRGALHERASSTSTATRASTREPRSSTASSRSATRSAGGAGRGAAAERDCDRVRANQARRRPAGQAARRARRLAAAAIHGNKSQRQREQALDRFRARAHRHARRHRHRRPGDRHRVGVSHVINFDPPDDHSAYVHRVGRTGARGTVASLSRSWVAASSARCDCWLEASDSATVRARRRTGPPTDRPRPRAAARRAARRRRAPGVPSAR